MDQEHQVDTGIVPQTIVRTLRRLIRRARMVITLRGICAVAAVAVGSLLAVMAVDYAVVIFSRGIQWALTASAFVLTALAALLFLVRPLARSFSLKGIAQVLEARHPEMHERISSTVQLLTSKDAPELRGSDMLIAELAKEATRDARGVTPRRELTFRSARPFLIAAGVVVAILGGLMVWSFNDTIRALTRAVFPAANIARVSPAHLDVQPGDTVIPKGGDLKVLVQVANKMVDSASFRRLDAEGDEAAREMPPTGDTDGQLRRFYMVWKDVDKDFRYRIHAGDALSRYYTVQVVPMPAVRGLDIRYDLPAYTGRPYRLDRGAAGDIREVAGTRVTIWAHTNKPVARAELLIDGKVRTDSPAEIEPAGKDAAVCRFTLTLPPKLRGQWDLRLIDEHGFESLHGARAIESRPDSAPIATVLHPDQTQLRLAREDHLPLVYRIRDDFGLSRAELRIRADGRELPPVPLRIVADENGSQRASAGKIQLDLGKLALDGAREVRFHIQAADNLPADQKGPQLGMSEIYTIRLDEKAETYLVQVQLAHELQIRQVLEKVLTLLQTAKTDSTPLRRDLPKAQVLGDATTQRIGRLRKALTEADGALRDLLSGIAGGSYAELSEQLKSLADDHVAKAENLIAQIRLTDQPAERGELADEADFQIDRGIAIVSKLLKKFAVLTDLAKRARQLQELAERQAELAAAKAAMDQPPGKAGESGDPTAGEDGEDDPPPMTDKEWREAQKKLAAEMAKLTRQSPMALGLTTKKSGKKTMNLATEARKLAKIQLALVTNTQALDQVHKADASVARLAATQKQLAAGARNTEAAKPMAEAAADLKAAKFAEAQAKQAAGEAKLLALTEALEKEKAAAELATKADAIAKAQANIARAAEAARKTRDAHAAAAETHKKQAQQAWQKATEHRKAAEAARAQLRKRQKALVARARKLEQDVARNPATAALKAIKPSAKMAAADRHLAAKQDPHARRESDQAVALAGRLAQALTAAAKTTPPPKTSKAEANKRKAAATKAAGEAKAIAAEQKKLSGEVSALAKPLAQMAKVSAAAKAAEAQQKQRATGEANARRQVAPLAGQQETLKKQVDALGALAGKATPEAKAALAKHNPAGAMTEAAAAMKAQDPVKAAPAAKKAAEQAKALAQAIRKDQAKSPLARRTGQIPQLKQLAQRQKQFRKQLAAAAKKGDALKKVMAQQEARRLQAEQDKLAHEAGELSDRVKALAPQRDRLDTHAARAAAKAATEIGAAKAAEAAKSAKQATEKLAELAKRLGADPDTLPKPDEGEPGKGEAGKGDAGKGQPGKGEPGKGQPGKGQPGKGQPGKGQPGKGEAVAVKGSAQHEPDQVKAELAEDKAEKLAELAEDTAALSRRQDYVARELSALAARRPNEGLASRQHRIQNRTGKVAEGAQLVSDHAMELLASKGTRAEAAAAAKALAAALAAQGTAHKAIAGNAPGKSAPHQRTSAAQLTAAAAALDRLGKKLLQEAIEAMKDQDPEDQDEQLADAFDAVQEAKRTEDPTAAERAAKLLEELSRAAMQQAQAAGVMPMQLAGLEMMLQASGGDGRGAGPMYTDLTAAELEAMGITLTDWARLPGTLRDEVLQAAGTDSPEEYRQLIKRYFQQIARRGGNGGAAKTGKKKGK